MYVWVVEIVDDTSTRRLRFDDVVKAYDCVAAARAAGFIAICTKINA